MLVGTIEYAGSPKELARQMGAATGKACEFVITDLWWPKFLPRHFTTEGARLYGYEARTKKYMIRKARTKHHQRPLEFTGESKTMMLRSIRVSSNSKGATGRIRAPRHFFQYHKMGKMIDKPGEATRVTADEEKQMDAAFKAKFVEFMNAIRTVETKAVA